MLQTWQRSVAGGFTSFKGSSYLTVFVTMEMAFLTLALTELTTLSHSHQHAWRIHDRHRRFLMAFCFQLSLMVFLLDRDGTPGVFRTRGVLFFVFLTSWRDCLSLLFPPNVLSVRLSVRAIVLGALKSVVASP